eukprot:SAG31_NODE_14385_length_809_cov_0.836850_1_plen_60_part_01
MFPFGDVSSSADSFSLVNMTLALPNRLKILHNMIGWRRMNICLLYQRISFNEEIVECSHR